MWSRQCDVEFGYQLSICSRTQRNHGKLDRVDRSQDLPDANWLLASSPALITRPLTLVSICAVALFEKVYIFVFTDVSFYVHTLDEHQTVVYITLAKRIHVYTHMHAYKHTYIYIYASATETNPLMPFRGRLAVHCKNHPEHTDAKYRVLVCWGKWYRLWRADPLISGNSVNCGRC
jgi:hypothetical protein